MAESNEVPATGQHAEHPHRIALAGIAEAIEQYGKSRLAAKTGAISSSRPGTYLSALYYWFVNFRLQQSAVQIRNLQADVATVQFSDVRRILAQVPLTRDRRERLLTTLLSTIAEKELPLSAEFLADDTNYNVDDFESNMYRFKILQRDGALDEAHRAGVNIVEKFASNARKRRQVMVEPAMLLGCMDMVPNPASTPSWTVEGRIAYLAATSLPYKVAGYTTRTAGVVEGYSELGYDVKVVTRPPFPLNFFPDLNLADIAEVELINGVEYHRMLKPSHKGVPKPDHIVQSADAMEKKLRALQPQIVVAASNFQNALPGLIAARRLGLPFVYEVRGMWELSKTSRFPEYAKSADFAVTRKLEAFVAAKADRVFTLTNSMRDDLVERGVGEDRISLMPNGVDARLVADIPYDDALAHQLGLSPGCPIVGYVGSILEYEGLPDLAIACIGLARRNQDFRLLIVGQEDPDPDGKTPLSSEIRQRFEQAGISDRLIMPGRVPFSEVPRYYSLIDIVVIPRRPYLVSEMISPIKPVEAMAMGKALLVSDVQALLDFTQDGTTAISFKKGDVTDLEHQLAQLSADATQRQKFGNAAQEFVRNNRTWLKICKQAALDIGLSRQ